MAKKKTTPARQDAQALEGASFPPIGEEVDPTAEALAEEGFTAEDMKAIQKQLAELGGAVKTLASSRDDQVTRIAALLAQRPEPHVTQPVGSPNLAIDFTKLPDPKENTEAFYAELNRQLGTAVPQLVQASVQQAVTPIQSQQQRQQRVEGLWKQFDTQYEDLADFHDLADAVAGDMLRSSLQPGYTPEQAERFIFGADNGATFLGKVADKLRGRIKQIRGDDDDGEEGDNVTTNDGQRVPRTLGVAGGSPAGGAATPKRGAALQPKSDSTLISELKEVQSRAGIY